jgi:hypothetical protein
MAFEVEEIDGAVAELRARGLKFETVDMGDLEVPTRSSSCRTTTRARETGERGAFFFDSEGNLLSSGQAAR